MSTTPPTTEPLPAHETGSGLQMYRVHGFCMVPTTCIRYVEASSPDEAVRVATSAMDWKRYIDSGSGEEGSAHDWQPDAVAVPYVPDRDLWTVMKKP